MTAFLRHYARTQHFTLGRPHSFHVSPDGSRVLFLRTRSGTDPVTCLWSYDVDRESEELLVDPAALTDVPTELTALEQTQRERRRERASGITSFATDRATTSAVFGHSGRLWLTDLATAQTRSLPSAGAALAPTLDPTGSTVAYVADRSLRVVGADGSHDRALAIAESDDISYGLPEHVAAESFGRQDGYWWEPNGSHLLVARVDNSPLQRWYIADPTQPSNPPRAITYPPAGTANADVSLHIYDLDGAAREVTWDRDRFEYVTAATWTSTSLLVAVQSRDQRTVQLLRVEPSTGQTRLVRQDTDPYWVTVVKGVPAVTAAGSIVSTADVDGARRLRIDDEVVSPADVNVREVLAVDADVVLVSGSRVDAPTDVGLWTYGSDGFAALSHDDGVHDGARAGGTTVVSQRVLDESGVRVSVLRDGHTAGSIASLADQPTLRPRITLASVGERDIRTALLLPTGHEPGSRRLPVLMDPYAGPGGQRVVAASDAHLVSQWFADQGFAVIVADGRGTPGRGPAWERTIYGDRGELVLRDQITALHAVAEAHADLDLSRVGIRGWSYGGFLAAYAVLHAPEVFHAAVAGAAVTDPRMYDTYWMERFLGHPDENPDAYRGSDLIADADKLRRPLMLVHGLADDNVVVAHTLRFSAALTAAAKPHTLLPLPRASHMVTDESIAAGSFILQAEFLKRGLNVPD